MSLNQKSIETYGVQLHQSLISRLPIDPITDSESLFSIEDAYKIQMQMISHRINNGDRVVGKKIGLTSKIVMQMLGVDQPDFGHLLGSMAFNESNPISITNFIAPKAEAEVAFMLGRDLTGPGITAADVLRATEFVLPCFEIVDSRIKNWKIKIQDTIADNASSGAFVLGGVKRKPQDLDLALAGMVLEKNGEIIHTSTGASVQGSPVNSVIWLANTLGRLGISLHAGEIILSGSQSPLVPVIAGDFLRCSVGGLGSASVRFN